MINRLVFRVQAPMEKLKKSLVAYLCHCHGLLFGSGGLKWCRALHMKLHLYGTYSDVEKEESVEWEIEPTPGNYGDCTDARQPWGLRLVPGDGRRLQDSGYSAIRVPQSQWVNRHGAINTLQNSLNSVSVARG